MAMAPKRLSPAVVDAYAWQDRARCQRLEVNTFFEFGDVRGRLLQRREERAKRVCRSCPVVQECLSHALRTESYGVWGGMTARERQNLAEHAVGVTA